MGWRRHARQVSQLAAARLAVKPSHSQVTRGNVFTTTVISPDIGPRARGSRGDSGGAGTHTCTSRHKPRWITGSRRRLALPAARA